MSENPILLIEEKILEIAHEWVKEIPNDALEIKVCRAVKEKMEVLKQEKIICEYFVYTMLIEDQVGGIHVSVYYRVNELSKPQSFVGTPNVLRAKLK